MVSGVAGGADEGRDGARDACVVGVRGAAGPAGVGVLVSRREIVTCAHVVNAALGLPLEAADRPDAAAAVAVTWPRVEGAEPATARVSAWLPVADGDLAVLALDAPAPPGATVAMLADVPPERDAVLRVFGYPAGRPLGQWAAVRMAGQVERGYLQLDSRDLAAPEVRRGYSGSPVIDAAGAVVGVVALAPGARASDSLAIPVARLRGLWRPRRRRPPDQRPPGADVVLLHLADLRFGSAPDGRDRLAGVGDDVWPDVVVVTGDLATTGRRSEYEHVVEFLERACERFELPRHRVAIVPGDHDVNRLAAQEYFLKAAADEEEPTPPYWPKWRHFIEAFDRFYAGGEYEPPLHRPAFTPDRPWTLFEMPDLGVAVAGLNSTMADSHRDADHRAHVDADQLEWFARRLELVPSDTLVVGAVHHAVHELGTDAGAALSRAARVLTSPAEAAVVVLPRAPEPGVAAPAPPADELLTEVAEITRVLHEGVDLELNPSREPGASYLLATVRDPLGPVERWPVGAVRGPLDVAALRRFLDVADAPLRSLDPQLRSHLVHTGPPADDAVRAEARLRGVVVHSLVEYRGVIDLERVRAEQQELIGGDTRYPAELFVTQRFRQEHPIRARGEDGRPVVEEDALSRIVEWLGEEGARFVTVLGDFGRGKTFLMRQLVRELPHRVGGLEPVLVELRTLEKGPDLYDVVGQHLRRLDVGDVTDRKVRHLIGRGRVAVLLDGFDELVQKVTYPTAAAYLTTLLDAATGEAKIVVTSRSQHFSDDGQVRKALLTSTVGREASRIVSLEDFGEDQIREFLGRHYAGDTRRADNRIRRLRAIRDLLDLARNPRLLSFVADLPEERLASIAGDGTSRAIGAADLYGEILDHWLEGEVKRQTYRFGPRAMPEGSRLAACRALALSLWTAPASGGDVVLAAELERVAATLKELQGLGFTDAQAGHTIGSGSLLTRSGDGFGFVHRSVMEWLVADDAAARLVAGERPSALDARAMSDLMTDFFCDLAGREHAVAWARSALGAGSSGWTPVGQGNATRILARLERRQPSILPAWRPVPDVEERVLGRAPGSEPAPGDSARPPDIDPLALDLFGQDLRDQDLAALSSMLKGAKLARTTWTGLQVRDLDLRGADLRGADLTRARFTNVDLTGATLEGATLDRTAFLGGRPPELPPDTSAVRIPGDPAVPVFAAAALPTAAVALPDLGLLALARGSHVELVDTTTWEPVRVLACGEPVAALTAFTLADGRSVLATGSGRRVVLRNPVTGAVLRELVASGQWDVTALAAVTTPAGTLLTAGTRRGTLELWDPSDGASHGWVMGNHTSRIRTMAAVGSRLATADEAGSVLLWERGAGRSAHDALQPADSVPVNSPDWLFPVSHKGTTMFAGAGRDGDLQVWDPDERMPVLQLRLSHVRPLTWAASLPVPDGSLHVAAGDDDDAVLTCEAAPAASPTRGSLGRRGGAVYVVAAYDGLLRIHAMHAAPGLAGAGLGVPANVELLSRNAVPSTLTECLVPVTGRPAPLRAIASAHGVDIKDEESGTVLAVLTDHSVPATSLAAVPRNGYTVLATAAFDATVRLYRVDAAGSVTPAGVIVTASRGGWAYLAADGRSYKAAGDVSDVLWWAVGLNRFEVGELDEFEPSIRRLPDDEPVLP